MAKLNPNRLQLLQFINKMTSQLHIKALKIEDLSSGAQYLHLLHQIHPEVVKMSKVNTKAMHQHENVSNLKLLAFYLSEIKAPFSFQVTKVSQRNYQENLNLLKNLYKLYFSKNQRQSSVDSQISRKTQLFSKKPGPKYTVKPPLQPIKPRELRKQQPQQNEFKNMMKEAKSNVQKAQVHKITLIITDQKQIQAEQKLKQIKRILGLQVPPSTNKQKTNEKINYSIKCSGSKSNLKNQDPFQSNDKQREQKKPIVKTQNKIVANEKKDNPQCRSQFKKNQKKFDCQQIKKSVLKKYDLRSSSYRKSIGGRLSAENCQNWVRQEDDEDTRYNQNLLSPMPNGQNEAYINSKRKSKGKMSSNNLSVDKKNQILSQNTKKTNISAEKKVSWKKQSQLVSSVKKNPQSKSKEKEEKQSQNKPESKIKNQNISAGKSAKQLQPISQEKSHSKKIALKKQEIEI